MLSLKVLILVVAVVVPHALARPQPQDFSQIFAGLTQELFNIAAAQAFQSQFETPGLRIRPSTGSSGNRYFYSVPNQGSGGSAFASISGAPNQFIFSGNPIVPTTSLRFQPIQFPSFSFQESEPQNFESVPNLRLGGSNRGNSASSSVGVTGSRVPVSVSAGAVSSS